MKRTKESRNKINMPHVGFGTYQLSIEQAEFCVKEAIKAGFRHIDSAQGYNNEEGTGKGIKSSGINRNELYVTTKLFPGFEKWGAPDKDYNTTIETIKTQLVELQLDYVDLYLIHAPMSALRLEQWSALQELKSQPVARRHQVLASTITLVLQPLLS